MSKKQKSTKTVRHTLCPPRNPPFYFGLPLSPCCLGHCFSGGFVGGVFLSRPSVLPALLLAHKDFMSPRPLGFNLPEKPNPPINICTSQCSLHNAPIFRLLLKVAVKGTHQCESLNFCGTRVPISLCNKCTRTQMCMGKSTCACLSTRNVHFHGHMCMSVHMYVAVHKYTSISAPVQELPVQKWVLLNTRREPWIELLRNHTKHILEL